MDIGVLDSVLERIMVVCTGNGTIMGYAKSLFNIDISAPPYTSSMPSRFMASNKADLLFPFSTTATNI